MEKKKLGAFNIVNIAVLGVGLVLLLIQMIRGTSEETPVKVLVIISDILQIIALVCGAIYMVLCYTDKAAILYKLYMYAFTGVSVLTALYTMTVGSGSMVASLLIIVILILAALLASAKDFDKVKTFIIAGLLLICQIGMIVVSCKAGAFALSSVSTMVMILEAGIMAIAKYRGKAEKGKA